MHIQQIRPGSNKYIELLMKCHPKKKPGSSQSQNNPRYQSRSQTTDTRQQSQSQRTNKTQRKCYGCGCKLHKDRASECPAWGYNCRKCNRLNHWESVCVVKYLHEEGQIKAGAEKITTQCWVKLEILL